MFELSRRDLIVALFAIAGTFCATAFAQSKLPLMKSAVFDWNNIENVGETPATYYAIKSLSPGMLENKAKRKIKSEVRYHPPWRMG